MSSTPDFLHDPLPDPQSYIRLLEILHGEANEQIVCQLTTWSVHDAPAYYALSYTWGNPKDTTEIVINGSPATVTANCEYALRQAHACTNNILLWMDALSIDQSSTQEKNHQVAMMGQIYEKAAHVLACIGPQSNDSEFLFELIDTNESLLHRISSHMSTNLVSGTGGWSLPNPIPKDRSLSLKCFLAMNASKRKRLLMAFVKMMQRPYFSRVWILQELHSASRSSFCCGNELRPFDSLAAISMLIDYWMSREPRKWGWHWTSRAFVGTLSRLPFILRRQKRLWPSYLVEEVYSGISMRHGCLALATGSRVACQLSDVMRAMPLFNCADVRDKLYGVLSLVDWDEGRGGRAPTPDYTKDSFSLAVEILQMYLDNPRIAPTDGSSLHWAEQLREVFKIEPTQLSMRTAIRARCSNRIAGAAILTREHLFMRPTDLFYSQPSITSTIYSSSLRKAQSRLKPDDTWYGKRLLDYDDAESLEKSADSPLFLRTGTDYGLNEIVDQDDNIIAWAPNNTRPHDIYMFTCHVYKELWSAAVPSMIVRAGEPSFYTIVGPAIGWAHKISSTGVRIWNQYLVKWSAEDLLMYCWAHQHATFITHLLSSSPKTSWLDLDICGSAGSSHVVGVDW
jgi:hypothetical protein